MKFKTGDIVKHTSRKSANYLVIVERNRYILFRVKLQAGYPISIAGRYSEAKDSRLTYVDHVAAYEKMDRQTAEQASKSNAPTRGNANLSKHSPPPKQPNFGLRDCVDYFSIPDHFRDAFVRVAKQLDPEVVSRNGTLSKSEVLTERTRLLIEWERLEKSYGMKVKAQVLLENM